MRTDEKDREGAEPGGARLMEFALKARKVFVIGEVNEKLARDVVQQLHILASISDEPIHMFVNSPGGHVESGDMIFDAIRFITPKVIMIGSGSVAS
ncbi:ATP-dependent Clp protease proteolytic subunit, partial [Pseudomonas aeruginosa]|nr:ATP-dependent Clp protease proteolytic subunit [Pseudomonas aeruginosa]